MDIMEFFEYDHGAINSKDNENAVIMKRIQSRKYFF